MIGIKGLFPDPFGQLERLRPGDLTRTGNGSRPCRYGDNRSTKRKFSLGSASDDESLYEPFTKLSVVSGNSRRDTDSCVRELPVPLQPLDRDEIRVRQENT